MEQMKKVLFLAYFYPPCGGAGVQRTVKFVKYLPDFGWLPIVVAGSGTEFSFPDDRELAREVSDVQRYDIKCFPVEKKLDKFLGGPIGRWTNSTMLAWRKAARRTVEATIKKEKPDVLFVTTSPFPAAKIIASVSRKYRIPWVLDLRDPWALDPISRYPTKFHYYCAMRSMKKVCQQAGAVIMNTPAALHAAVNTFKDINPDKFYCITNGWDKEDFQNHEARRPKQRKRLKIIHTGQFHTKGAEKLSRKYNPLSMLRYSLSGINLLTRTPHYLFAAYRKLIDEKKISLDEIRFIFAGTTTNEDRALVQKYQIEPSVEFTGYLNHEQAIDLLFKGDMLFLPLHELDDMCDPLIVPGKTYEYLATGKPILACVPEGDARNYILKSGLGYVCNPADIDHIAQMLFDLLEQHKSPEGIPIKPNDPFIAQFERRRLTRELVNVLENVCKFRPPDIDRI